MVDVVPFDNPMSSFSSMEERVSQIKNAIEEMERVTNYELEHFIRNP